MEPMHEVREPPGLLERLFMIVALLYFSGGLIPSTHGEGESDPGHEQALVVAQLIIFPILCSLCWTHRRVVREGLRAMPWLMVLCGYVMASSVWSYGHFFTFHRAAIFVMTTVFGVYLGCRFDPQEQSRLLGWALASTALAAIMLVLFVPSVGISHDLHSGDWKGSYTHKNRLGLSMAFAVLLFLCAPAPRNAALWKGLMTLLAAALLLKSNCKTALLCMTMAFFLLMLAYTLKMKRSRTTLFWWACAPALMLFALAMLSDADLLLQSLGRDATLTGRTALWSASIEAMSQHGWRKIAGYGYATFWSEHNPDGDAILNAVGWFPEEGHNGYLDVYLDLGFVGCAIVAAGLVTALRKAVAQFKSGSSAGDKWPLICLFYLVSYNMTESELLRSHTFLWVPFVASGVTSAMAVARQRQRMAAVAPSTFDAHPALQATPVLVGEP